MHLVKLVHKLLRGDALVKRLGLGSRAIFISSTNEEGIVAPLLVVSREDVGAQHGTYEVSKVLSS